MALISISNLKKKFDDQEILKCINLEIRKNSMTVILGKSGEGKSVLLKHIAGLLHPDEGSISINNQLLTRYNYTDFNIGYVFQFAALLDSLTIFENLSLALKDQKRVQSVHALILEKLNLVHLDESILDKFPCELSGGMRKRVGIARTLLINPAIILYDEPTTGLDPITSRTIHELIFDMQKKLAITSIIISHDISIFDYAHDIAFLHDGKIQWHGKADSIWHCDDPYIYQFIRGLSQGPIQVDAKNIP
jgi:phospholipid/cholesterol/gamma-HCH transport system ATP-binding protein